MKKAIVLLFVITATYSYSSEVNYSQFGFGSNFGINFYPASFSKLSGIPNCCPTFGDTDGISYGLMGIYEYYFDKIGISANFSFNGFGGEFLQSEPELFSINYEPVLGTFNHHLNFNITSLDLEIGVKYQFEKLSFGVAIITSLPINSSFQQYESISIPSGRVFFLDSNGNNTGKNKRNEYNGDIPNISSILFSPSINIAYNVPLDRYENIIVRPQLSFNYQLNNIVSGLNWNRYQVNFSISLLFNNNTSKSQLILSEEIKNRRLQDSILAELAEINRLEQLRLQELRKKDSLERIKNENLAMLQKELSIKDSIEKYNLQMQQELAMERLEFDRMIEEQNKLTGSKCNCFVIQFISTTDKNEFNKIKMIVSNIYKLDIEESVYTEQYQKIKFYRLQSKCFKNHLEAFDERMIMMSKIDFENFLPKILCK